MMSRSLLLISSLILAGACSSPGATAGDDGDGDSSTDERNSSPGSGGTGDDPDGDGTTDDGTDTGDDDDGGETGSNTTDNGGDGDGTEGLPPSGLAPYGQGECDDSDVIDLGDARMVEMTVDTSGTSDRSSTSDDCSPFCHSDSVPDQIFKYTAPTAGTVLIRTDSSSTDVETTTLTLFDRCGGNERVLACDAHTRPRQKRLLYDLAAGDTIFIAADGCSDSDTGDIELSVEFLDTVDSGQGADSCDNAVDLNFIERDGRRWAQAFGEISGATPDLGLSCATDGGEVSYRFTANGLETVRVSVEPLDGEFDPAIAVTRGCEEQDTVCMNLGGPGEAERMDTVSNGDGDPHEVVITGTDGTTGNYRLVVTLGEND